MSAEPRPEVHLRMLTADDAGWLAALDEQTVSTYTHAIGLNEPELTSDLFAGRWASDDDWGWAIMVDGEPSGFALVTNMTSGDGRMHLRVTESQRGRGVGREVLRQLADHHFKAHPALQRLVGQAHEGNLPMQRAFNAAGFRMEARFRSLFEQDDGELADVWGYALTRAEWEAGRHQFDFEGYDLHGLRFVVEDVLEGSSAGSRGLTFTFWQEGNRVTATFWSRLLSDGELAGVMSRDVVKYRYVQGWDRHGQGHETIEGRGRARVQRAADGRLQIINEWADDDGRSGSTLLVEYRG